MSMKWTEYEEFVFQECLRVFGDSVKKNVYLPGRFSKHKRQIDVLITPSDENDLKQIIAIEVKYYSTKIDVKIVESFIAMLDDVGVEKGIIVSSKGFSKSAVNRAYEGTDNIEVDILSIEELKRFQSPGAIIFSGRNGFAIITPFGWVVDATRHQNMLAILYRRGFSDLASAALEEKVFMYINIFDKQKDICSVEELIKRQELEFRASFSSYSIRIEKHEEITLRFFESPSYPTLEVSAFREQSNCILLAVLFCPVKTARKDIEKLMFLVKNAIYINVLQHPESCS
ncbi:MAG: restriction endonuclease [Bacteroidales bacterium]|nr:restriction endonuclease [Bacteroidales bacterium]